MSTLAAMYVRPIYIQLSLDTSSDSELSQDGRDVIGTISMQLQTRQMLVSAGAEVLSIDQVSCTTPPPSPTELSS